MSPAAAAAEQTVDRVVPRAARPARGHARVGLVTGAQMANVTALAAARHAVLGRAGWDVEAHGLAGAPPLRVIAGAEAHATVFNALRLLGLGRDTAIRVPADEQGRMRAGALAEELARGDGPTIVCAQAGNVNTGAFDPFEPIVAACRAARRVVPRRRRVRALGRGRARPRAPHRRRRRRRLVGGRRAQVAQRPLRRRARVRRATRRRSPPRWRSPPPTSRPRRRDERNGARLGARGLAPRPRVPALGRAAPARPPRRRRARRAPLRARRADRGAARGASRASAILNDVVLNQVLVRFGDDDAATDAVIARVQDEGTCWLGGTRWQGARRDADLGLGLADDGGRRRPLRRRDRRRMARRRGSG